MSAYINPIQAFKFLPAAVNPFDVGMGDVQSRFKNSIVRVGAKTLAYAKETKNYGAFNFPSNVNHSLGRISDGFNSLKDLQRDDLYVVLSAVPVFLRSKTRVCSEHLAAGLNQGVALKLRRVRHGYEPLPEEYSATDCLSVLLGEVDFVTLATVDTAEKVEGADYICTMTRKLEMDFAAIDWSVEGYPNMPTARLAMMIESDQEMRKLLNGIRTKKGPITQAGLERLVSNHQWRSQAGANEFQPVGFERLGCTSWLKVDYKMLAKHFSAMELV